MREAWQAKQYSPHVAGRKVTIPDRAQNRKTLSRCRENAQYFAALGAVELGAPKTIAWGCYRGYDDLLHYIEYGRAGREGEIRRQGTGGEPGGSSGV